MPNLQGSIALGAGQRVPATVVAGADAIGADAIGADCEGAGRADRGDAACSRVRCPPRVLHPLGRCEWRPLRLAQLRAGVGR
ncbi:hypothetical protein DF3PA_140068 [Candidatus Defluviicoccus seviourii]|uniref:Uncharacterized protein n=1 Tax=Candidatus Defluviicoccus seviourii TaxID=2565273 RepID=A0A564WB06_9PROT|nr:hypothetical protein DF3PA_140068 [Candidatus Defluviicoccus seviourii]